jgi:DNA-binding transcriptional regulator GbsR (MarR family)
MILRSLGKERKTPSELSEELGVSLPTVSITLKNLRQVNLVRYETVGLNKKYWIKDNTVFKMLDAAENLAEVMRKKRI